MNISPTRVAEALADQRDQGNDILARNPDDVDAALALADADESFESFDTVKLSDRIALLRVLAA